MNLFTVDKKKCKKDGRCAFVCPVGIIAMDAQGFPEPVEAAEERCIDCGHCVAVCPHAALSLRSMPAGQCVQLPEGWNLSFAQVEHLLKGRRSIRAFKKDVVDRATIEQMIDIARYAPSGINRQPVRWVVVHDTEKVRKIAQETIMWMKALLKEKSPMAESFKFENLVSGWEQGKDFICRQAPHMVLTYALNDDFTAPGACTIAGAYLEIAALPQGVGTCWAGYAQMALNKWPACQEILNISKKCSCFGAFLVGYPQFSYPRIPLRNAPKITWR
jgi:nitroreductase/NAD-dependent dihydropyrimidine dehydrogenase PreA subunit